MQISERSATFTANTYRFAFQGYEQDNEVSGSGNSYTTHFRQYDSRLGRWFGTDPMYSAGESPYVSMGNNPISYIDILGDVFEWGDNITFGYKLKIIGASSVLRLVSKSFREQYKTLRDSPNTHVVNKGTDNLTRPLHHQEHYVKKYEYLKKNEDGEMDEDTYLENMLKILPLLDDLSHRDGTGSGSYVELNFKGAKQRQIENHGTKRGWLFSLVGHEIAHPYDINKGESKTHQLVPDKSGTYTTYSNSMRIDFTPGIIKGGEPFAVKSENKAISDLNRFRMRKISNRNSYNPNKYESGGIDEVQIRENLWISKSSK